MLTSQVSLSRLSSNVLGRFQAEVADGDGHFMSPTGDLGVNAVAAYLESHAYEEERSLHWTSVADSPLREKCLY